jgi:hypothetical protein
MTDAAEYRREAKEHQIGSPYRVALYVTARCMKYTKERALQAAKVCDPKVVKRFESGK